MKMREKKNGKKSIDELIKEVFDYIPNKTEEEMHKSFQQERCPYGIEECNGSGYIKEEKEGRIYTKWCQCYLDEVMKRKFKASKIETKYWNAEFHTEVSKTIKSTLLHPKKELDAPKMIKKGRKEVPETPKDYINRVYEQYPIKKGVSFFAEEYTKKSLQFIDESPRLKCKNLMLLGEPGVGKTHLTASIAKEYLKEDKSVYFTTMLNLVADVMNPEVNIRKVMKEKDLVIIDEVGYEYHTDTQWALKQIKELFRIRYNAHLPIITTTNFYPNELAELYDPSLMSMFNGSYFFVLMEREHDIRLEEASEALKDFTFIDLEE